MKEEEGRGEEWCFGTGSTRRILEREREEEQQRATRMNQAGSQSRYYWGLGIGGSVCQESGKQNNNGRVKPM